MPDIWSLLESIPVLGKAVESLRNGMSESYANLASLVESSIKSQAKIQKTLKAAGEVMEDAQGRIANLEARVARLEEQQGSLVQGAGGADVSGAGS
jgi:hypothetical protein